jgi:alkaline phosphatase D
MSDHDPRRRDLLEQALLLGGAAASGLVPRLVRAAAASPDRHPGQERTLTRIAFGSCAKESKDQPIWQAVLDKHPDLFVFLGDNVYGDTRDMEVLRGKYAQLAAKPGFRRLKETTPLVAVWDDHDFGENDAGADYPFREESRRIFLTFWEEPTGSPRWERDGIYAAYVFGPPGRRVQVLMPDLRYNRTPVLKLDLAGTDYEVWAREKAVAGLPVPGPYARNPDPAATMLGKRQWAWLEAQLQVPAEIRIIASSLQVLADLPGWEAWINYAHDHQRLIDLLRRTRAEGVIFISGDTHYAELSHLNLNVPYPLWDVTSSGLTEVWPVVPPNANRVGAVLREPNFGLIEIDWSGRDPLLRLKVCDIDGKVRFEQELRRSVLSL